MYHEKGESKYATAVLVVAPEGIPMVRDPKKPEPRYWKLPGGRSEGEETPEECAVREVEQETGLILEIDELTLLREEARGSHTLILFRADIPSLADLKMVGAEQEEIRVFTKEEIPTLPDLFPNHRIAFLSLFEEKK